MKYLGESLFSESDKDFEYKLNLIKILTTPREAKKFTNDSGETPNISMIQDDKKDYLTASEMKQRMDSFTSDIDEDNLISLRQWFNHIKCTDKKSQYKFLRDILNKSKFKSDIPIFDKLWATEKYKNDMLKSPIQSDSKGNIKWSSFIHKYITDSKLPANITGSKVLGIDGAPIKK